MAPGEKTGVTVSYGTGTASIKPGSNWTVGEDGRTWKNGADAERHGMPANNRSRLNLIIYLSVVM